MPVPPSTYGHGDLFVRECNNRKPGDCSSGGMTTQTEEQRQQQSRHVPQCLLTGGKSGNWGMEEWTTMIMIGFL